MDCKEVTALFDKFQNPAEADKLTKIQKDLDEILDVTKQSMDDLMKRGESMTSLIDKTAKMSSVGKEFRKMAERNNSWCAWFRHLLMG